jgi:hypothetical protein
MEVKIEWGLLNVEKTKKKKETPYGEQNYFFNRTWHFSAKWPLPE